MKKELSKKTLGKGIITLISTLSVAVVGLSGYIVYDKFFSKNTKAPVKEKAKTENKKTSTRKLNESEISELMTKIKTYNKYISSNYPIKNISDFSKDKLFDFSIKIMINEDNSTDGDNISADKLDEIITKYFGNSIKLEHKDILCSNDNEILYNYNKENKTYSINYNHPGHGGGAIGRDGYEHYIEGSISNETDIVISTKNLYSGYCSDICGPIDSYYKNFEDSVSGENPVIKKDNVNDDYLVTENDYDSIKDSIPITTYKFIKDKNGNYYLVSVSI